METLTASLQKPYDDEVLNVLPSISIMTTVELGETNVLSGLPAGKGKAKG